MNSQVSTPNSDNRNLYDLILKVNNHPSKSFSKALEEVKPQLTSILKESINGVLILRMFQELNISDYSDIMANLKEVFKNDLLFSLPLDSDWYSSFNKNQALSPNVFIDTLKATDNNLDIGQHAILLVLFVLIIEMTREINEKSVCKTDF